MKQAPAHQYSVIHPDFKYPRCTNLYWKKIKELNHPQIFLDHDTENKKGNWSKHCQDKLGFTPKEIHLEIGCNGGHVLLELASQNPENLYIGIDWKFKQIYLGLEKAIRRKINNIIFLRAHALRLPYTFATNELNALYLYFPDPWPKTAQRKNRLFQKEWLLSIHSLLHREGIFKVKTDHAGYYQEMLSILKQVEPQWRIDKNSDNLHQNNPHPELLELPEVTLFEKIFIKKNLPIHMIEMKKRV